MVKNEQTSISNCFYYSTYLLTPKLSILASESTFSRILSNHWLRLKKYIRKSLMCVKELKSCRVLVTR